MLFLNLNRLSNNIISNCHFSCHFSTLLQQTKENEYFQSICTPLMQNRDLNRRLTALKKSLKFILSKNQIVYDNDLIFSPILVASLNRSRKIPKISPGAYIFQRPFFRGLFLEGLIFEGAYLRREICVSKSIGLAS